MARYGYDVNAYERDLVLWKQLIEGNKAALGQLFDVYAEELLNYGFHIFGDKDHTKDAIQDVFVDLWRYRDNLKTDVSVKFYLFRCLRNRLAKYFEKEKTVFLNETLEEKHTGTEPSAESIWMNSEIASIRNTQLKRAWQLLSGREREIISLKYYSDLKIKDIAALLHLKEQTIANTLQNALIKLRKNLVYGFVSLIIFFF